MAAAATIFFFGLGLTLVLGMAVFRSKRDATALLSLFAVLLLLIPARLVFPGVGGTGTPANVVALLCAGWWAVALVFPSLGLTRGPQPIRWAVLGYVAAVLLSYAVAFRRPLSELEMSGMDRRLIELAALVGVALITADGVDTRQRLETLLRRVVVLASVVAGIGVVQFLFEADITPSLSPPGLVENLEIQTGSQRSIFSRPYSTSLHPIEFSVVLAAMLPLALHFAFTSKTTLLAARNWTIVLLLAGATAMGVSRSGILGIVVGLTVLSLRWTWRRRLNAVALSLCFVALMKAAVPGLIGTLQNLFSDVGEDPSIQGRLKDVAEVKSLLSERPLTGRGAGSFNTEEFITLDNEYYKTFVEVGLTGIFALVLLLVVASVVTHKAAGRHIDPSDRHLGQAILASLLTCAVTMATFDGLGYPMFSGVLFMLIGAAGAFWRLSMAQDAAQPSSPAPMPVRELQHSL